MGANQVSSFADLLVADSDFVMPTVDKDVQAELASFGAGFKKTKGEANMAARADPSARYPATGPGGSR